MKEETVPETTDQPDETTEVTDENEQDVVEVTDPATVEADTFPRAYVEQLRDEAARYRTRAGRADELHRRLVDTTVRSAAADHLADPGDILVFADEADLLDDDGYPDPDKIVNAARALATARPHLAPRRPRGDIGQGATAPAAGVDLAGILRARAT